MDNNEIIINYIEDLLTKNKIEYKKCEYKANDAHFLIIKTMYLIFNKLHISITIPSLFSYKVEYNDPNLGLQLLNYIRLIETTV